MNDNLKPCPFCGGEPIMNSIEWPGDSDVRQWFVCCRSCAAQGGWAKTENGARRWWNMRQPTEAALEALRV